MPLHVFFEVLYGLPQVELSVSESAHLLLLVLDVFCQLREFLFGEAIFISEFLR